MVFKTIITFLAEKRIPMIKFRKGGNVISSSAASQSVSAPTNQSKAKTASASASTPKDERISTSEEYWQLHPRFQRRPIDEFECEYINRGGPDKL